MLANAFLSNNVYLMCEMYQYGHVLFYLKTVTEIWPLLLDKEGL